MKVDVLQTGSAGNCCIINNMIALDMGVAYKKVAPYINSLKLVFVGHRHQDHFKQSTIKRLAKERPGLRFCGGAWMVDYFLKAHVKASQIDVLEMGKRYDYGAFQIEAFSVKHDVPNAGLKLFVDGKKAIYIVDAGNLNGIEAPNYDLFLIECNHDETEIMERIREKEAAGEFAYERRVIRTHLSYQQANDFIYANAGPNSEYLYLHQHQERTVKVE